MQCPVQILGVSPWCNAVVVFGGVDLTTMVKGRKFADRSAGKYHKMRGGVQILLRFIISKDSSVGRAGEATSKLVAG